MSITWFINFAIHIIAANLHWLLIKHVRPLSGKPRMLRVYAWNMIGCTVFHMAIAMTYLASYLDAPGLYYFCDTVVRVSLTFLAGTLAPLFLSRYRALPDRPMLLARLMRPFSEQAWVLFAIAICWAVTTALLYPFRQELPLFLVWAIRDGSLALVFASAVLWILLDLSGLKSVDDEGVSFSTWPYRLVAAIAILIYLLLKLDVATSLLEPLARFSSIGFALVFAWDRFRLVFLDDIVRKGLRLVLLGLCAYGVLAFDAQPLFPDRELNLAFLLYLFAVVVFYSGRLDGLLDRWWYGKRIDREHFQKELGEALASATDAERARETCVAFLEARFPTRVVVDREVTGAGTRLVIEGSPRVVFHLAPLRGLYPWYSEGLALVRTAGQLLQSHLQLLASMEDRRRESERARELAELAAKAELSALRAQIRPHFLFNVLNTIHAFVSAQPEKAEETIELLADLMRGVLEASRRDLVGLGEELALAETYLRIEKARHGTRLDYAFVCPPDLEQLPVPAFSLQPLVENAVKHGLEGRPGTVTVTVTVLRAEDRLHLSVSDDGPGLLDHGGGLGVATENIRGRLRRLYGDEAELVLRNGERGGAVAELSLPVPEEVAHDPGPDR